MHRHSVNTLQVSLAYHSLCEWSWRADREQTDTSAGRQWLGGLANYSSQPFHRVQSLGHRSCKRLHQQRWGVIRAILAWSVVVVVCSCKLLKIWSTCWNRCILRRNTASAWTSSRAMWNSLLSTTPSTRITMCDSLPHGTSRAICNPPDDTSDIS